MGAYTQGELKIQSAISIDDIKEFTMDIRKGEHASVFVKGEVTESKGKNALLQGLEDTELKVVIRDEMIFRGVIRDVTLSHEGKGYQILLHGISSTVLMDTKKKSRSFQDIGKTYMEIMQETALDTENASLKVKAEDRKIKTPLYQLEETDWEFIKRLSSHLEVPVIPTTLAKNPQLMIGLPDGKLQNTESAGAVCERVWRDRQTGNICRCIRAYENWNIGDRLKWEGKAYPILQKNGRLENGIIYFRYVIAPKEVFAAKRYHNSKDCGVMLIASVIDAKDEQVKVKFDMDEKQQRSSAFWYPWRPDAGNIMYCMPEIGERVYVYLGDETGENPRVVCGIHKNGTGNPEMNPANRYFTTAENKRMYFTADTLGFTDLKQSSPLQILLKDASGTNIISNQKLMISARDMVGIKGSNIFLQAPKEVSIVRRDNTAPTVINMCNGFDSVGATNEVTASGGGGGGFPVFQESRQEEGKEYCLDDMEKNIIASTPGMGLKGNFEKIIEGMSVDKVMGEE